MNNFQFYHKRIYKKGNLSPKGGRTYAIEDISSNLFKDAVLFDTFPLQIGVANCVSNDLFSKVKGRELSILKKTTEDFIVYDKSDTFMIAYCQNLKLYVRFQYKSTFTRVRMVGVENDKNKSNLYNLQ